MTERLAGTYEMREPMKRKIEKLTAEQAALLPVKRDEWLVHGLSVAPADRNAAVEGVFAAYAAAGLPAPEIVVWLDSPMSGAIGAAMLASQAPASSTAQVWDQVGDQVGAQVRDQVWDQVGDQVGDQVWAQVRDQVRAQVGDQVWAQVGAQVRAQVGDQVWAQVGAQVRDQVWDQVGDQVGAQVGAQVRDQVQWNRVIWGQHDAGWLGFYDTFAACGLADVVAPMRGMVQVAKSAGWWWPMRGAVVLTDRPAELHLDNNGRLHCETGPAIAYRDGFGFYAWHGTRVPADLIEGEWSLERIMQERNTEIRRCAIERRGWDRFVDDADLQPVDECADPANAGNRLALYDLPEHLNLYDAPVRLLLMVNASPERDGTVRRFGETVPATCKTAIAAAAWQFDVPVKTYKQLARAT